MPNEAPTLRETLESAMTAQVEAEPLESAPVDAVESPAPETAPTQTAAERARDEAGRFAKVTEKTEAAPKGVEKADTGKAAAPVQGKTDGVAPPTAPSVPPVPAKVPQSWKPAMRELAAKLPAEFHPLIEESLRRDGEVTRALQETAEARRTAETVQRTLQPFEGLARSQGMDAMQYAGSVLQTAAALHMGTPQQKAAVVAQLIGTYGIDVDAVNAVMQGQAPAQTRQQSPTFDARAEVQRVFAEERQRLETERAQQVIQEFTATEPEFLNDVWQDMVAVIESDKRAGRNPDLKRAYDRACRMNEDVSKVLDARRSTEAARAQAPTVQRAKVAGASIKPSAAAATPRQPTGSPSIRETIEAAIAGQRT